jgi:hypothetical protein
MGAGAALLVLPGSDCRALPAPTAALCREAGAAVAGNFAADGLLLAAAGFLRGVEGLGELPVEEDSTLSLEECATSSGAAAGMSASTSPPFNEASSASYSWAAASNHELLMIDSRLGSGDA